jgi:hypothetical protein
MYITLSLLGNGLVKDTPILARQQLGKLFTAATNTHTTVEELLDIFFYAVHVVSRNVDD